ncbi:MAG: restriction endonuclease subunit S [Prolixibacteraceae bacterium]|jgi:type I restriction enzyme S subunit
MSKYISIDKVVESVSITHKFNKAKLLFLNTSDIEAGKIINTNFLPISELKGQAKKTIRKDDILFSEIRPKNRRFAYVDFEDTEDYVVSTKLMVLRNINPEVDNKYFYYFLTNDSMLNILQSRAENRICSFPQITFDLLSEYKIRIPDILEQQKIASVLSSLDSKIELNNRINRELEQMAKLLYDYWFVQFEFPNAEGRPYKSTGGKMVWNEELKREIPEGWKVGKAADLFSFNPTLSLKKGSLSSYIDMNALPTDGFMTKEVQLKEFNGGVKFQNGDLVVARITPCLENGKTGLISLLNDGEVGFGSTEFIVLRGRKMKLSSFAACFSRSEIFRKYAISNMTGTSGRKRVDSSALEIFSMAIPPKELLTKFEETVSAFFEKATLNTKENQQLASLRDWLLPMLMNGQVTVGAGVNSSDDSKSSDELAATGKLTRYEVTEGMDVAAEPGGKD